MKQSFLILAFLFLSGLGLDLHAQKDTIIDGKRYRLAEEQPESMKNKRHLAPLDSEFVINNKRIKYYNNWLTAGAGVQQNLSYKRDPGFVGGLDYNFHIRHHYFQLGALLSGERFGSYNNYQFHLGYGKRHEDRSIHVAGFAGISYSTGYGKVGDTVYTRPFNHPGLYLQVEAVKKITYDVGIGASIFADWNQEQAMLGGRIMLYFSGAYRGKQNDQYRGK